MRKEALRFLYVPTILALVCIASPQARAKDVSQEVRSHYQGKELILRGFYSADHLHYDSAGALINKSDSSDWTSDGFVAVINIHLSGQRLIIDAQRMVAVHIAEAFQLVTVEEKRRGEKEKKPVLLTIEAELATDNPSDQRIEDSLARIFLTSQDDLSTLVPVYWKTCLQGKKTKCTFSPQIQEIPGIVSSSNINSVVVDTGDEPADHSISPVHVGGGVRPPRIADRLDPEFSDRARQARIQGTVTLGMVVDKEGHPIKIRILDPLGCGLDEKAVQAVERWKFNPATKDGEPVAVEIAVEVDFHLY